VRGLTAEPNPKRCIVLLRRRRNPRAPSPKCSPFKPRVNWKTRGFFYSEIAKPPAGFACQRLCLVPNRKTSRSKKLEGFLPGEGCPVRAFDHSTEMIAFNFAPSWSVEELDACFVVPDHDGQQVEYVYFEDERDPDRWQNCWSGMRRDDCVKHSKAATIRQCYVALVQSSGGTLL
jgi:hypothetical protein